MGSLTSLNNGRDMAAEREDIRVNSNLSPEQTSAAARVGEGRRGLTISALVISLLVAIGGVTLVVREHRRNPRQAKAPVATASTVPTSEEGQILDTVRNYFRVDNEALRDADPHHPLLSVYAAGPQLQAAADAIATLQRQGLATRTPANSIAEDRARVLSIDGDHARVAVCSITDSYLVRADSGQAVGITNGSLVPVDPTGHRSTGLFTATVTRESGVWRVWSLKREQTWDGVAGCAEEPA